MRVSQFSREESKNFLHLIISIRKGRKKGEAKGKRRITCVANRVSHPLSLLCIHLSAIREWEIQFASLLRFLIWSRANTKPGAFLHFSKSTPRRGWTETISRRTNLHRGNGSSSFHPSPLELHPSSRIRMTRVGRGFFEGLDRLNCFLEGSVWTSWRDFQGMCARSVSSWGRGGDLIARKRYRSVEIDSTCISAHLVGLLIPSLRISLEDLFRSVVRFEYFSDLYA